MARTYQLSEKDANRLEKMLRWFERERKEPMQGRRRLVMDSGGPVLAKTQEAAPAANHISVKLIDSSGNVTGDAFSAYGFFPDGGTNDLNACLPLLASNAVVPVFLAANGKWYILLTFITYTECP